MTLVTSDFSSDTIILWDFPKEIWNLKISKLVPQVYFLFNAN